MNLVTINEDIKVVYDTNNNNAIVGLLNGSVDSAAHEAISAPGVRVSVNTINSPDGEVLYLDQVQVNDAGIASKI